MNVGVPADPSQAEQMERDLDSLPFDDKLHLEDGEEEDEDEDEEFSFVCANPDGSSPISADDAFYNGQIRPVYPLFNRDLLFVDEENSETFRPPLRKVFVEKRDTLAPVSESELEVEGVIEGTYCEWSPATAELGKKSNSTGFSKLWRFRDFMTMHRSSSDGKDAFVFLSNPSSSSSSSSSSSPKPSKNKPHKQLQPASAPKVNRLKPQTPSSAHETHYVRSRAQKQVDKHKSYLPYRQDLVGFFTTVNGFSKNVHPF
ncbi:uncharacterized protein LOC120076099 [Benincasa hispida]|uniref:uncharacterized protein LOC120076099 n=1 Tax=Benincasa hispida TaxID=102211 RepID=UPI0018FF6EA1|nr:uncharacterized protein LOC120076099 [Benincasa hispida]